MSKFTERLLQVVLVVVLAYVGWLLCASTVVQILTLQNQVHECSVSKSRDNK